MNLSAFVRLVLDPLRLQILGAAATDRADIDEIVERSGASRRQIVEALGKLRAAGLLDADYRLDRSVLAHLAESLPRDEPPDPEIAGDGWTTGEGEILARFFNGSRLSSIPSQHAKRLVVLERLAQEFEPGMRYSEKQVNFTLQLFHPDFAALRRYLVDNGFLTRADGVYWRTGGRT